ncbi:hypothetical protein KSD_31040 [Ktedonobacter sp. SOSP1-85]|nr:hypothetical protein KSD_31040 [Ktedonobacter sp. SOSP1-85]
MVVEQKGEGAAAANFAEDDGWGVVYGQALDAEAILSEQRLYEVRHFFDAVILGGDAALAAEAFQKVLGFVFVFVEVCLDGV